jgi:hypothetical protein
MDQSATADGELPTVQYACNAKTMRVCLPTPEVNHKVRQYMLWYCRSRTQKTNMQTPGRRYAVSRALRGY